MIRWMTCVSAVCALAVLAAGSALAAPEADCQNDSKSLGRTALSTEDTPGTWWYITRSGFDSAGITDYKAAIEAAFGTTFADLDEAVAMLVEAVGPLDKNGNGFVCASELRGTRSFIGDPNFAYYYFAATDDKHA